MLLLLLFEVKLLFNYSRFRYYVKFVHIFLDFLIESTN